jgi:hypothetical protein
LRDEVTEQLAAGNLALDQLAADWRHLLFPDASDAQFADGYAQAVVFGMLMARARGIELRGGLDRAAKELGKTSTLIAGALRLLTDEATSQAALKTSLGTLSRVLDAVHWDQISRGDSDKWLYFYEDFLEVYDNNLRKQTGSYYTPAPVVHAMVRLVDNVLRTRFGQQDGFASAAVTVADPACGTGTFILGILRRISEAVESDQGSGASGAAISHALRRLIAFELQLGPFAVAELRVLAEVESLTGAPPDTAPRMFVADTLSNPYEEQEWIPGILGSVAQSRRQANEIKRDEPITVVMGNPPYKEKAKGRGSWVEAGSGIPGEKSLLDDWQPPAEWGVGAHAKHLRNLYVFFWRWATWKVFDHDPTANHGVVCFITVAGFLSGAGFEKMRDYLRRKTDDIWVIDCSPEGHRPDVPTRIFEAVQHRVCIVIASRSALADEATPSRVRFRSLPTGNRNQKFEALSAIDLDESGWQVCPTDWRAPFFPAAVGAWGTFPLLETLFIETESGVMPGRTWVIAPDVASLEARWEKLKIASTAEKEALFHPHLRGGAVGDKHVNKPSRRGLGSNEFRPQAVAVDTGALITPVRYGFRSFDRQWVIPDNRLLNQPNPGLWQAYSARQFYLTAPSDRAPTSGPALTVTAVIPDLHHYAGRGGRVIPLLRESGSTNVQTGLLEILATITREIVSAEDTMAYIVGAIAHPAYRARFRTDLAQPGLRVPITRDAALLREVIQIGKRVIWLQTFGARFVDARADRPAGPPRMTNAIRPTMPRSGAIPRSREGFPNDIQFDETTKRLHVGSGFVEGVTKQMWEYEVSGMPVIRQWFSSRRFDRERPLIGDRRPPSVLGEIQPDVWPAEYTTELLDLLNVLGLLIELHPRQADLLDRVCAGPTVSAADIPRNTSTVWGEGHASPDQGMLPLA